MKKFLSILFLGVFLYNIGGYYLVFQALQVEARDEMNSRRRSDSENELETIGIAAADTEHALQWHETDEFEYAGNRYDVVRIERRGDTTFYYCFNDSKEESLVANLNEHVQHHIEGSEAQKKESKVSLKNVVRDYFYEETQSVSREHRQETQASNFDRTPRLVEQDIPTPPPKA